MKRFLILTVLLSGCVVGPNYRPPEINVSDCWQVAGPTEDLQQKWWELFCDPQLNKYIELGALYNREIAAARANICQARAMRQVAASKLFPQIDADFNALHISLSKNGLFSSAESDIPRPSFFPSSFNLFNAFLDASWEIDLFGKTRRNIEVQEALIGVAIEEKNDLLISIFAEIASNYVQIRSAQNRIVLIEKNAELLERNVFVVRGQVEKGLRSGIDLERIEGTLFQVRAQLPDAYAEMLQGIYALSVLTGNLPETFLCELGPLQPLPTIPCEIAVGLRSDLLRRRPDVREAERNLAAATANIGVQVAAFFPSLKLYGFAGFQSVKLRNLFSGNSLFWAADGNLGLPLFHGGNLRGNLYVSEAAAIAAGASYQQAVLTALQEAETGLALYTQDLEKTNLLATAVQKNGNVVTISNARFTRGLTTVLDLLDTERNLIQSETDLLATQTKTLLDLIYLYKALGGGWELTCN